MTYDKPFSQACENNKAPILKILKDTFKDTKHVLEIGSGTGQHAIHFAPALPHLIWQTADQTQYHDGINAWLQDFPSNNLRFPQDIHLPDKPWQNKGFDAFFSANTAHIMQRHEAKLMMQLIDEQLPIGGIFCQYGPFTQNGEFSSQSNLDFHKKLLSEGYGGYRDIEELISWTKALALVHIKQLPANNLLLIWKKHPLFMNKF